MSLRTFSLSLSLFTQNEYVIISTASSDLATWAPLVVVSVHDGSTPDTIVCSENISPYHPAYKFPMICSQGRDPPLSLFLSLSVLKDLKSGLVVFVNKDESSAMNRARFVEKIALFPVRLDRDEVTNTTHINRT